MNAKNKNQIYNSDDETIVAVITPPGEGGVAALRIAGKQSLALLKKHFNPISKSSQPKPFPQISPNPVQSPPAYIQQITKMKLSTK